MSDSAINIDRLLDLAEAVCDEVASRNDFVELDSLLLAEKASRRQYWDYCRMHILLEMELQANDAIKNAFGKNTFDTEVPDVSDAEIPIDGTTPLVSVPAASQGFISSTLHGTIGFFSQELPFSLLIGTVLTGLGLWFASMIYVSSPDKIARDSSSLPSKTTFDPTLKVVGKITGMVDCKWADPNTETFNGANVLLGRKYVLASGLMEITYDTGAKVILQGPVAYEVEANGGYLSLGKLTGKLEKKVASGQWSVPSEANPKSQINKSQISNPQSPIPNPFCIRTPNAVVTDLGTEFGVEVQGNGAFEVHVLSGQVDLTALGGASRMRLVAESEKSAARLEPGSQQILTLPAAADHFVRVIPQSTARRDVVVDWSTNMPEGSFTVARNDLLQTSLVNVSTNDASPTPFGFQTLSALSDGTLYGPGETHQGGSLYSLSIRNGKSITFALDTRVNKQGYTIGSIDVYTGGPWYRIGQKFKVQFSQVGQNGWLSDLVIDVDGRILRDDGFWEARSHVRNRLSADTPLATHVDRIRFTFYDQKIQNPPDPDRPWILYREIDVIGSPTGQAASPIRETLMKKDEKP